MFNKDIYIERRKQLCNEMKEGVGLFLGNESSSIVVKENHYDFVQDSSFLYYFGINREGLIGIVDFSSGETYISGKDYSVNDIVWMGDQPSILEMGKGVGVENFIDESEIKNFITEKAKNTVPVDRDGKVKIHYVEAYRATLNLKISELLDIDYKELEKFSSVKLKKSIIKQRNIKTAEEIDEIERAVNITQKMHLKAYEVIKPGMYEYEIKAEVEKVAAMNGCKTSFQTIATIHGETLHNRSNENILKEGDLFLLDCGAKLENGYCGDMTSVIPVSGRFSEKQRIIYEILIDMYNRAVSTLKIGEKYSKAYVEASRALLEGLKRVGLVHGEIEEMLGKSVHAMFFPHGLGHMLGLDGHDCEPLGEDYVGYSDGEKRDTRPGYRSMRLARIIEEGFVFTVEPGVYFISKLIDDWETKGVCKEYINFEKVREYIEVGGMRYESDFAVVKGEIKKLGEDLPKTVAEVEEALKLR